MTHRGLPRTGLLVAAMCIGSSARAGVWTTDPVLGLAAEYSTNPDLLDKDNTAETHGAILIDAPTTYHGNSASLQVLPSFRIANSTGYSSLASDYAHFTVRGEVDSERDSLTITGQAARDSSLYYNFGVNGSSGVRRDTTMADLAWVRLLTERLNFNFDANSSRVVYGKSNGFATLTSYRYSSATPSLSWNAGERTTLSVNGSAGLYGSADGTTKSSNANIQFGIKRQIDELWTVSASAGYSTEDNRIDEYFGPFLLGSFKSTNTGTVFAASVTRQGRLLAMTVDASRSLVPTGFSFLSLQNSYQFSLSYPWTDRWTLTAHAHRLSSTEPEVQGPTVDQSYVDFGLSAVWLLTEKWTLTMGVTKVSAKYTSTTTTVAASGVSVALSRHFDTIKWQ